MIDRFNDHAANERTYLAWVRTVLAIAGFGILIDRIAPTGATRAWVAPALIGLSTLLLAAATVRFRLVRRMIQDESDDSPAFIWSERLLAGAVFLLVSVTFVFLVGLS